MRVAIEAEQSVLGALLTEPSCLAVVRPLLPGPQYFAGREHQEVYRAVLELADGARHSTATTRSIGWKLYSARRRPRRMPPHTLKSSAASITVALLRLPCTNRLKRCSLATRLRSSANSRQNLIRRPVTLIGRRQ